MGFAQVDGNVWKMKPCGFGQSVEGKSEENDRSKKKNQKSAIGCVLEENARKETVGKLADEYALVNGYRKMQRTMPSNGEE